MQILKLDGLCKQYPAFRLENVSFSMEAGTIMGLIGRNGAGKTTTLKSMLHLVHPDAGTVTICGLDMDKDEREIRSRIGFVSGGASYYQRKRLRELTDVTRRFYPGWDDGRYARLVRQFSLDESKRVCELSEGMKVKYQLAAAMSHRAELLILDEPTSGLDPVSRDELLDTFRTLCEQEGVSILFSTHITSDLDACADTITYIQHGRVAASTDKKTWTGGVSPAAGQRRGVHACAAGRVHRRAQPQRRARSASPQRGRRAGRRLRAHAGESGTDHGPSGTGGGSMKLLMKKEWKLVVTPVPLLFLLLSALVLVPSYPYYVTFFYNALGIFLMLQAARENRDVYYMALLPVTKRDVVRARFSTIVTLQLLQIAACIPFMLLRRSYAQINNPVGIEANLAFLGFGFVLMGLFNLTFLPMHYKNGYDLGKPFVVSSVVLFLAIVLLETLDHVVPYMKTVCESYAPADLVRQLPVLLGGVAVYALVTYLAFRTAAARFEQVDL